MQAAARTLASRYARALFSCAREHGEEAAVGADLEASSLALSEAGAFFSDPRVAAVEKRKLVQDSLRAKAASLTMDFLELLMGEKRFVLLGLAAQDYAELSRRQRGAVRASVRSAGPLSAEDSRRLRKCLEAFSGCVVEMEVSEEPELLGGVAVRLGDWVMDSSLKGRLQSLKEAIGGD